MQIRVGNILDAIKFVMCVCVRVCVCVTVQWCITKKVRGVYLLNLSQELGGFLLCSLLLKLLLPRLNLSLAGCHGLAHLLLLLGKSRTTEPRVCCLGLGFGLTLTLLLSCAVLLFLLRRLATAG